MPRISEVYGIVITMYYAEHGVTHFHALYSGEDASVAIETLEVLAGSLPDRALRLFASGRHCTEPSSRRTGNGPARASRSSASRR